ncbi:MAG: hypothetical protein J6P58_01705, partial [Oscillospiraceae bacterium]|nr:hypothetical protein [Oscillospiraceae bacterium]
KCPGCGRGCDLCAPSCPRGEAYARGESPEAGEHGHDRGQRPGRPDGTAHDGRAHHGGHPHGHGEHHHGHGKH